MVILTLIFLLLSNSVTLRRDKSILYSRSLIYILIIAFVIGLSSLNLKSLNSIGILGGLFHTTSITNTFHIFIFFVCAIISQLTAFYPRKVWTKEYSSLKNITLNKIIYFNTKILNKMGEQFKIVEYPLILLFIITGATFLISSSDIVSIFISIELQSYGLYLLSTLYRNSELSTSAGLTYFLLGGLSSCFILLGISLLYVNSGTTNLDGYYIITNISEFKNNIASLYSIDYINFSLLIMSVGFLFKISAAPFHFWSPDVYDAIPTIVTTFVAIIAKISIFVLFLGLINYTYNIGALDYNNYIESDPFNWTDNLLISCFLSLLIGSVLGLVQFRIKRLYAYSTINHIGFILLALCINSLESTQAFIFYIIQYSISNLNAFIILISMGYFILIYYDNNKLNKELKEKNNSPIQLISQLKGFYKLNNILSLSLTITLLSFLGIPPLLGFFGKQMVLSSALSKGYIFITLIAVLTSVISAVYYLVVIKHIFFDKNEYTNITENKLDAPENKIYTDLNNLKETNVINNIKLSSNLTISISILTLLLVVYMFTSKIWLDLLTLMCLNIFNL